MKQFIIGLLLLIGSTSLGYSQELFLREKREDVKEIVESRKYTYTKSAKLSDGTEYDMYEGPDNLVLYFNKGYCIEVRRFTMASALPEIVKKLNINCVKSKDNEWLTQDYKTTIRVEPDGMFAAVYYINIFPIDLN